MSVIMANAINHGKFLLSLAGVGSAPRARHLDRIRRMRRIFSAGCGKTGFIKSMCSNYTGLLWGMLIILSGGINNTIIFGAVVTGFFSWLIVFQSHIDVLSLWSPNTFMGGFSAFASGGDWKNALNLSSVRQYSRSVLRLFRKIPFLKNSEKNSAG